MGKCIPNGAGRRTLAISDIHGCFDEFIVLLDKVRYVPGVDQLILLGDYIDRGPDSFKVVQMIRTLVDSGAIALKGNHEQMLVNYMDGELAWDIYARNGGDETLTSYSDHREQLSMDVEWLDSLPLWHETNEAFFVHAGLTPTEAVHPNNSKHRDMLWIREEWLDYKYCGKLVVFGHTPHHSVKWWKSDGRFVKICIDTGCVYARLGMGRLTCLEIDGRDRAGSANLRVHSVIRNVDTP